MSFSRRRSSRRAARSERAADDLTRAQWLALLDEWYGCAYCLETEAELEPDCVVRVERGGERSLGNVVPACATCRASKRDVDTVRWLRDAGFDDLTFLVRQREIANRIALELPDVADTA